MKQKIVFSQTISVGNNMEYVKPSVEGEFEIPDELIEKVRNAGSKEEKEKNAKIIMDMYTTYENLLTTVYKRAEKKLIELHENRRSDAFDKKKDEIGELFADMEDK